MNSKTMKEFNFDKKTLNNLTIIKLKELSTSLKLKLSSGLNKDEIITLIQRHGRKINKNNLKNSESDKSTENNNETKINKTSKKSNEKPAKSNEKPAKSNEKPAKSNEKPAKSNEKPAKSNEKPAKSNTEVSQTQNLKKALSNATQEKSTKQKSTRTKSPTRSRNETANKTHIGKYKIIKQLGTEGKEGTCYLVENKKGEKYAMKCFAKSKSSNMLQKEALAQKEVAKYDLAPNVKEVNEDEKYIVMDYLDKNLFDIVKKNHGEIPEVYQKKVANLILKLDETGVFHGDPNPANFMLKGQKMYIIDFGFAKDIDDRLIKKYNTETPNQKFMPIGLVLKLKEIYRNHNPNIEYKVLSKYC